MWSQWQKENSSGAGRETKKEEKKEKAELLIEVFSGIQKSTLPAHNPHLSAACSRSQWTAGSCQH